jgi:hypothetical protein
MKLDADGKGTTNLGNAAANNWQNDTASHTRRLRSSAIPLRELQSPQDILKILPQAQTTINVMLLERTAIGMCSIHFCLVQDGAQRLSFRLNTPSLTFSACFQGLDWNRQGKGET